MNQAKNQAKPSGPDHQHEWVPHDAERNLSNVKGQRVEPTVSPKEPGSEACEEGRAQRGQVYEPKWWEPERLGEGPVALARAEEEDYCHGQRKGDRYRNEEGPKGSLALAFFLVVLSFWWGWWWLSFGQA